MVRLTVGSFRRFHCNTASVTLWLHWNADLIMSQSSSFVPYIQAKRHTQTLSLVGFEMLARRVEPDGSVSPPSHFMQTLADPAKRRPLLLDLLEATLSGVARDLMRHSLSLAINLESDDCVNAGDKIPQ